jgi:hypothetical protein
MNIVRIQPDGTIIEFQKFQDDVLDYIDYLGVYEYTMYYNTDVVSQTFSGVISIMFAQGYSIRKVGITLFSGVMNNWVMKETIEKKDLN